MESGEARGGAPISGPGTSELPDLALAGAALRELHALWAGRGEEPITIYIGLESDSGRVHVGWIRDRSRRAVRLSGRTVQLAVEMARAWTRNNPTRAGR